jgi:hypothetical protein
MIEREALRVLRETRSRLFKITYSELEGCI